MLICVLYHMKQGELFASEEVYLVSSEKSCLSSKKGHPFHFANIGHCHFVDKIQSAPTRVCCFW